MTVNELLDALAIRTDRNPNRAQRDVMEYNEGPFGSSLALALAKLLLLSCAACVFFAWIASGQKTLC
jgi:hypothetical protein